jgi:hypothetical protein
MKQKLYRLDLQFFADEPTPGEPPAEQTEPITDVDPVNKPNGKVFTQEELDEIVKQRIAREKKKAEEAAEQARLEAERKQAEQNEEYQKLYETERQAHEKLQAQLRTAEIEAKKTDKLVAAGYAGEALAKAKRFISGESDEELDAAIEDFKAVAPPKVVGDPSTNNGGGHIPTPAKKDSYEAARERAKKLLKR